MHWEAPKPQPQAFPKDSSGDLYYTGHCWNCLLILREDVCWVLVWLTLFAWMVSLSPWTDRLSIGPICCTFVFIPPWSLLYKKAFVEWFDALFYNHSAGWKTVTWPLYLSKKITFSPSCLHWLPSGRRITQESLTIFFHLSVLRPFRNCAGTPNLKFIGLYLPQLDMWFSVLFFFSDSKTDR